MTQDRHALTQREQELLQHFSAYEEFALTAIQVLQEVIREMLLAMPEDRRADFEAIPENVYLPDFDTWNTERKCEQGLSIPWDLPYNGEEGISNPDDPQDLFGTIRSSWEPEERWDVPDDALPF